MQSIIFLIICLFSLAQTAQAQLDSITLQESYRLTEANYPLTHRLQLIEKSEEYSLENAATGHYPGLNIYGRATYQSEVTQIPVDFPGVEIPGLNKDQYKIYGEVTFNLYDGGMIEQRQGMIRAESEQAKRQVGVQLYAIRKRINQLFFGILLMENRITQNQLYQKDISLGIDNIQSAIDNGLALESELKRLQAELLKAKQKAIEIQSSRTSYVKMLELFLGEEIDTATVFIEPVPIGESHEILRPQLSLFESRVAIVEQRNAMLTTRNRPKVNLFLQGGFGRPGLNFLSNDFEPYFLGGIQLKLPLSGYYTLKKDRTLLKLQISEIELRKEEFLLNTQMEMAQTDTEIEKLKALLETDDRIISLLQSVKETLADQLNQGMVNTADYLQEVNAENLARQNRNIHRIQWLMAQYELQWTAGSMKNKAHN